MADSNSSWPPKHEAEDIVARLLEDDPVAASDLAVAYLDPLAAWLQRYNPQIDDHICTTAAEDAILSLIKNPKSFDPKRLSLDAYLRMSAKADLKNLLRAESRHRQRRASLQAVEQSPRGRKYLQDMTDPAIVLEREMDHAALEAALAPPPVPEVVAVKLSRAEAMVLDLQRSGEKKTAAFAQILGIAHLPADVQRREVKRTKDRINRRLERAGGADG